MTKKSLILSGILVHVPQLSNDSIDIWNQNRKRLYLKKMAFYNWNDPHCGSRILVRVLTLIAHFRFPRRIFHTLYVTMTAKLCILNCALKTGKKQCAGKKNTKMNKKKQMHWNWKLNWIVCIIFLSELTMHELLDNSNCPEPHILGKTTARNDCDELIFCSHVCASIETSNRRINF